MTREELSELNQLVNICLDNAELSVKRGRPISMQGWVEQVNAILSLHGYTLLTGKGTRSSADARPTQRPNMKNSARYRMHILYRISTKW